MPRNMAQRLHCMSPKGFLDPEDCPARKIEVTKMEVPQTPIEQLPSLFLDLPYELRRMIWEETFESRRIPLILETVMLDRYFQPPFRHLSHEPRHPGMGEQHWPGEYTSFLTCPKIESPAALSVHRESRDIALSRYKPWRMFNRGLRYRTIMWYPRIDIVDLLQTMTINDRGVSVPPLPIFVKQFPDQITEVKTLAVTSKIWGQGQHKNIDVIWPLIDFVSLEEFVVAIDVDAERDFAKNHTTGLSTVADRSAIKSWTMPEDIDSHVSKMRMHYKKFGPEYMPLRKQAKVRVVEQEADILGDKEMNVILRCQPCHFLDNLPDAPGNATSN